MLAASLLCWSFVDMGWKDSPNHLGNSFAGLSGPTNQRPTVWWVCPRKDTSHSPNLEHEWVGGSFWGWYFSKSVLNFWNAIMYLLSKFRVHFFGQTFNSCDLVEWTEGCLLRRRVARNSSLALPRCVFEWWLFKTPRCLTSSAVGWVERGCIFIAIGYGVFHTFGRENHPRIEAVARWLTWLIRRFKLIETSTESHRKMTPSTIFHSFIHELHDGALCFLSLLFVTHGGRFFLMIWWVAGRTKVNVTRIVQVFLYLYFTLESRTLQEKVYSVNLQTKS